MYIEEIELYMIKHDFLAADKYKVRIFLKDNNAIKARLTRKCLMWTDNHNICGVIGRSQLGIQDNFK